MVHNLKFCHIPFNMCYVDVRFNDSLDRCYVIMAHLTGAILICFNDTVNNCLVSVYLEMRKVKMRVLKKIILRQRWILYLVKLLIVV